MNGRKPALQFAPRAQSLTTLAARMAAVAHLAPERRKSRQGVGQMLVVTANWAIGDGTVHGGPPRSAVREFLRELRRAAWRAGFRRDGRYRPLESVQLVFAGDTLDGIASTAWLGGARPWQGTMQARAVAARVGVAALSRGIHLLAPLRRLARDGLSVPRADHRGRPIAGQTQQAPVTIVCLVGDRDRPLEDRWLGMTAARHHIAIGIEQASETLVIRHGDEFDPACGPRDQAACGGPPSLAESLAIDLLADFVRLLRDGCMPPATVARLGRLLATAHPLDMPRRLTRWLATADDERAAVAGQAASVREAWARSVRRWHSRARRDVPQAGVQHDVVDDVATWMEAIPRDGMPASNAPIEAAIAALRPSLPGDRVGGAVAVLGHPAAPPAGAEPGRGSACICLGHDRGGDAASPGCDERLVAVAFPDPAVHHGILPLDGHDLRQPPVARVGISRDESGIVDAA